MAPLAIEIESLSKRFSGRSGLFKTTSVEVLDAVSLTVDQGELLGLTGPRQSGKSTLLKILGTLLLPTSGEASVAGIPITQAAKLKPYLGVVLRPDVRMSGWLRVRENLEFCSALQGVPATRAGQLIEEAGLGSIQEKRFSDCSKVEQRMVSLIRPLLHDPSVLLLDEPMAGLISSEIAQIQNWIQEIWVKQKGKTVVVATDHQEELQGWCDRVAFLREGKIFWSGPPDQAPWKEGLQ